MVAHVQNWPELHVNIACDRNFDENVIYLKKSETL